MRHENTTGEDETVQSHETAARAIDADEIVFDPGPDERDEFERVFNGLIPKL